MSKSILYASNTNAQTTTVASMNLNLGSPVRRYGNCINTSGGNIIVQAPGYYDIDVLVNFASGETAGTVVVTVYQNGTALSSASQSVGASSSVAIVIPTMARTYCCNPSTITIGISGVVGTVNSVYTVVTKE